jgi:outer membrane immunogenic protein
MKKLLVAGIAAAAFLSAPALAAPPAGVFNWSGFYIGGNAGYAWGKVSAHDTAATNGLCWVGGCLGIATADSHGFTGGGQMGINAQFGSWLLGAEAEVGYLGASGSGVLSTRATTVLKVDSGAFVTARGRLGFLFGPSVLVYGTGGLIAVNLRPTVTDPTAPILVSSVPHDFQPGLTVGGGIEVAVNSNWSWKAEYLHYHINTFKTGGTFGGGTTVQFFDVREKGDIARLGLNYKFGS